VRNVPPYTNCAPRSQIGDFRRQHGERVAFRAADADAELLGAADDIALDPSSAGAVEHCAVIASDTLSLPGAPEIELAPLGEAAAAHPLLSQQERLGWCVSPRTRAGPATGPAAHVLYP